jgi:hypothetical protein
MVIRSHARTVTCTMIKNISCNTRKSRTFLVGQSSRVLICPKNASAAGNVIYCPRMSPPTLRDYSFPGPPPQDNIGGDNEPKVDVKSVCM